MADAYYPWLQGTASGQHDNALLPGVIHHRPCFAHVEFMLTNGQVVLADGGALIWKDAGLAMTTETGECMPACWRRCAGESCCQNKFTGPGKAAFSFKLPGDIHPFMVKDVGWKLSAGAFICGTENIRVDTQFGGCFAFMCGGEEAWLSMCESRDGENALFYAGGYGAITEHKVPEGNTLQMSSGCFFAAPTDANFELRMPGGCVSCCFGGEGIVVAITGDCTVFTQNRNPAIWKTILRREGVKKKQKGTAIE